MEQTNSEGKVDEEKNEQWKYHLRKLREGKPIRHMGEKNQMQQVEAIHTEDKNRHKIKTRLCRLREYERIYLKSLIINYDEGVQELFQRICRFRNIM
jgi:hypothetical protein